MKSFLFNKEGHEISSNLVCSVHRENKALSSLACFFFGVGGGWGGDVFLTELRLQLHTNEVI